MRRLATFGLLGLIANMTICDIAPAQTTTGSTGCAAITQAGVNGLNARIQADDSNINAPQSVTSLTCLDNFFNGVGLNLVTNLLSPANLLQAVEGKICNLVQQTWNSLLGKVQCGLTVSGFNLGFGGIGGGLSCPKLSFGGGGPPIATIARIHDLRGEAGPNMPSHYGQAQAVASISQQHLSYYCDANDVAAGLCGSASSIPDADQQFSSLFGAGTYADQNAVNTAKDYAINLIQPIAPAALRGDQLNSAAGQDAAVRRRSYNARMSLAQSVVDQEIGIQTPSVPLTPLQQQYLTNIGLPSQTNGSWLQVLQIESERRISDITWAATLQSMPPASVEREIAIELALSNYLQFQIFKMGLQHTTISATQLAETVERDFQPTVRMPVPSMAASN